MQISGCLEKTYTEKKSKRMIQTKECKKSHFPWISPKYMLSLTFPLLYHIPSSFFYWIYFFLLDLALKHQIMHKNYQNIG